MLPTRMLDANTDEQADVGRCLQIPGLPFEQCCSACATSCYACTGALCC